MGDPILDESTFRNRSPGAGEIFDYLSGLTDIPRGPWDFDYGTVTADAATVWASFSCVTASGFGRDKLHITALLQADGSWALSHRGEQVL